MNPLVACMVRDLEAASPQLLESGIDASGSMRTHRDPPLLVVIRTVTALVPRLLDELLDTAPGHRVVRERSWTPTHEPLSRRMNDYRWVADRVVPVRWVRTVSVAEPDEAACRWLLHLLAQLAERLEEKQASVAKQVEEALRSRGGSSQHGQAVEAALLELRNGLTATGYLLDRARRRVLASAGQRLKASSRRPGVLPSGEAWAALRRLEAKRLTPQALLEAQVNDVLRYANAADIPYLFQRWCGLKIVERLTASHWSPELDPTGPLWLGGRVPFRHPDGHGLELWVEPRLERERVHPSGFRCARGHEVNPDYMIVTPGPGGRDAFLLDPTLSTDRPALEDKGKYLDRIELGIFATVAGCPVVRKPRLSWALAPLPSRHGHLLRSDGRVGAVPMNPLEFRPEPLEAWLADVTRHAVAWSLVAD